MTRLPLDILALALGLILIASTGNACGAGADQTGCTPPPPPYEPPPEVVPDPPTGDPADPDPVAPTPRHAAYAKCCIDPADPRQRIAKTDLGATFPRLQRAAHAACQAQPLATLTACPPRLMGDR
ncbi:MAG: hypothetical protein V4659_04050 [Pseudomonadota bacterium]